ncbi:CoA transferase [Amycolatopsis acidiphila]|uniref:CoA transferase n=1 Tax=Amycolatopsis acidiphila TaxID=715473 RepID=A0A558AIL6_9PSEU|nr:CaiB/BaiF CoA-transferase family protein [Amycolatopsis acidiphila]TVT24110.1 CoA transferase [Amycolatopsis acidiphila]UIJ57732.1 CoA transferase [Amycolatopsis acidiphila]GHG87358.1 putative L-carnitine dehydratase [Amycolatopsis acidiphila]
MTDRSAHGAGRGPLAEIRVLELGSIVAGPFAGRLLADYGADVIKIEAPGHPDPLRDWGQREYRGHRLWWTVHARNKRCITLDLRSPAGQELFLRLVERSDVIIENFRPGTLEKWQLGYDRLRQVNEGIILARVSGFGQTGPYRHRPGYASVTEAMGGLRAINGYPGQAPPRMAISLGDSLGALFAVHGVLAALQHRNVTGRGQVVDVALTEAALALLESVIPEYDRTGAVRRPSGTRLDGIAPSNLFVTKDEKWVIVAANQDTVFGRLCQAIGRPELAGDERFATHVARGAHQDEIEAIVAEWVAERTAAEVGTVLEEAGVVCGPVYTAPDIVADPQFRFREMLVPHYDERVGEDVLGPGVVPKFSETPGSVRWAGPPAPGTHNDDVFGGLLGLPAAEIAELGRRAVL